MTSARLRRLLGAATLLVLGAVLYLRGLGATPLLDPDEPRYAAAAREMARGGDLVVPRLNGEPRLNKPILFYWLQAASIRVLGEGEASARLPSALAAIATVLATAAHAASRFGGRAGFFAGAILAASPQFVAVGRAGVTDMTVALFSNLAFFAFDRARRGEARAFVAGALAAGLAAATKGPPAFLPVALALGAWSLVSRERFPVRGRALAAGIALFLAVALAWPVALALRLGAGGGFDWIETVLGRESVGRFFGGFQHPQPPTYYLPVLAGGFFPWVLFLPWSLVRSLRREADPERRASALGPALFAATVFVFFSLSRSKLASYLTPAYPSLAILVGASLARARDERGGVVALRTTGVLASLAIGTAWVVAVRIGRGEELSALAATGSFRVGLAGVAVFAAATAAFPSPPVALAGAALAVAGLVGAAERAAPVLFDGPLQGSRVGTELASAAGRDGDVAFVGRMRAGVAYYADRRVIAMKALDEVAPLLEARRRFAVAVDRRRLDRASAGVRAELREVAVIADARGARFDLVVLRFAPNDAGAR